MLRWRSKTTAPLLVPLLLMSMAALATTPPQGRVFLVPSQTSRTSSHTTQQLAVQPLAEPATCTSFFDVTGQLSFNPPNPNTPLTPAIGSSNIIPGGPAFASGTAAVTATASGHTLTANPNMNSVTPTQPVALSQITGIAYFATSTNCTATNFTNGITLQSSPVGPAGEVSALLNGSTTTTASATYVATAVKQAGTYTCSGTGYGTSVACDVFQINVVVSFLPLSFAPSGAGTYTLTINQVTITP